MSNLRALLALAAALCLQVAANQLWAGSPSYLDFHMVPVAWFALAGQHNRAMWVGCLAGLSQDAWFHGGVFGLNGFKKTLLGWVLGLLGSRFDLNANLLRFLTGVGLSLLDSAMDLALRRLIDRPAMVPGVLEIGGRALCTGLLVLAGFLIVGKVKRSPGLERRA